MNKLLLLHKRFFLDYRIFVKINRDVNLYIEKIKFYIKYVKFNIITNKNRIETKLFKN